MHYLLDNSFVSMTYFLVLRRYMHKYIGLRGRDACNLSLNGSAKRAIIICLSLREKLSQMRTMLNNRWKDRWAFIITLLQIFYSFEKFQN